MNVLIADDEPSILEGLKCIIDWEALGFTICATASNGVDALEKILNLKPDLVLMDIRMPRMLGIDVIENARRNGYTGKFIILSGMSDFAYAQKAMHLKTDFYLTKPIDDEELEQAVISVREGLLNTQKELSHFQQYREKAKDTILIDLLLGKPGSNGYDFCDLRLNANVYQVVIYENYNQEHFQANWSFEDLFHSTGLSAGAFDSVWLDNRNVVLLKGSSAMDRFDNMLEHYRNNPQKGSPLESLFLMYGRRVTSPEEVHLSYEDTLRLSSRRFFCAPGQHLLAFNDLPAREESSCFLKPEQCEDYSATISNAIQSRNRSMIASTLSELERLAFECSNSILDIKHFLTEVYLQVKQKLQGLYGTLDLPLPATTSAITYIENKYYLYEIILFLSKQFDLFIKALCPASASGIIDDILYYIEHNYKKSLKLETIAPLFGYNSSYLGKLFTAKTGTSFNSWLDQVRINHSKELLNDPALKVYEIAERVGYKNVDYFHKKFKKYVGESPAEYRKHME